MLDERHPASDRAHPRTTSFRGGRPAALYSCAERRAVGLGSQPRPNAEKASGGLGPLKQLGGWRLPRVAGVWLPDAGSFTHGFSP